MPRVPFFAMSVCYFDFAPTRSLTDTKVGEGYTVFKRKRDDDDNDGKKQNAARIRPHEYVPMVFRTLSPPKPLRGTNGITCLAPRIEAQAIIGTALEPLLLPLPTVLLQRMMEATLTLSIPTQRNSRRRRRNKKKEKEETQRRSNTRDRIE